MTRMPDFDDLVESNEYVRNRYLACHDRLVVILWGSFQRAIADLTQLYKEKLDNQHCDQHYLLQALGRIGHFHTMSQRALQLVEELGKDLGYDVGRLLVRDAISWSSQSMTPLEIYKITLCPFGPNLGKKRRRISSLKHCRKCNRLRRQKSKRQRCILQSPLVENNLNQLSSINSFEFFPATCDRQKDFTFSCEQLSSPFPSTHVNVSPPSKDLYQYPFDLIATPIKSKLKRPNSDFRDYQDFGLTDSMSKVCLHQKVKKPRREPMLDDPF
ncbi:unnamed protein product [Rodentolepis nana]|uniref:Uncharacterized protein n=1 Tax=Rodentolepis nana TaxID=102285 RepID=A0A0R3TJD3_RODNA|nr:unnamed protein product [Rodentolepis nana]